MAVYLAFREIWRNRSRFVLFSLVIALITVLVLFVAALGEGLAAGNREYIQKLGGELVVYDNKADLLIAGSRIPQSKLVAIRRVAGVQAVGPVGFANVTVYTSAGHSLKVALVGVEPGQPGDVPVVSGSSLAARYSKETVIDANVAQRLHLRAGDTLTVRSTIGTEEDTFDLRVLGVSDSRQYSIQPAIFVPFRTWDEIRPQAVARDPNMPADLVANIVAVKLTDPANLAAVRQELNTTVPNIVAVDRKTAYEATPGYSAQQSTLNTQRYFALLIGVLVIGGFFQILTLQKVPQIGMLKAVGASNLTVGMAAVLQILAVTLAGVLVGTVFTLALSLTFPASVPIVFSPTAVLGAVASLMLIGPLGGLVSVRYSVQIEPLTALGLAQ